MKQRLPLNYIQTRTNTPKRVIERREREGERKRERREKTREERERKVEGEI